MSTPDTCSARTRDNVSYALQGHALHVKPAGLCVPQVDLEVTSWQAGQAGPQSPVKEKCSACQEPAAAHPALECGEVGASWRLGGDQEGQQGGDDGWAVHVPAALGLAAALCGQRARRGKAGWLVCPTRYSTSWRPSAPPLNHLCPVSLLIQA